MPVRGFRDADGQEITFEDVRAGLGRFTTRAGAPMPLPLLTMLSKNFRDTGAHYGDEDAVSVTQLIAPVQQQRLLERHDVFVDPLDGLWATWGTLAHAMLEAGVDFPDHRHEKFLTELKLVQDFDGFTLGGTIDLLERSEDDEWNGRDYKITSAFQIKKMMKGNLYQEAPDYFWQGNLYRLLATRAGYAVPAWQIVAICRDWNERMHGAHCGPVEVIDVPLLEESRVLNFLKQRIIVWKASAMASDAGLPSCSDVETWGGNRCKKYCAPCRFCWQFNPSLELEDVRASD